MPPMVGGTEACRMDMLEKMALDDILGHDVPVDQSDGE
jgi:hypothetical protein